MSEVTRGTVVGRYIVERLLGEGGGGRVYEATHADLKKRVALKVLSKGLAGNSETRARFLREGELATRIRHPHVVDVTDFGVHDGLPFLVMEYLEGESLQSFLTRRGVLELQEAVDLMLPVVAAVGAAHDEGIVHRDLKPSNVFLSHTRQGTHPKLLDFGISKLANAAAGSDLTRTASMLGTPHYMAPEQVRDARATEVRSDQYSLGVILYQMVTGSLPFEDEQVFSLLHKIVYDPLVAPRQRGAKIPVEFEDVVLRALEREPARRFPSVYHLGSALLPFAAPSMQAQWKPVFMRSIPPRAIVEIEPMTSRSSGEQITLADPRLSDPAASAPTVSAGTTGNSVSSPMVQTPPPVPRRSSTARSLVIGGIAVAAVGVAFVATRSRAPTPAAAPAASYAVSVHADPPEAIIELDGVVVGQGSFERALPRDGAPHRLLVRAASYFPSEHDFRDAPPASSIVLIHQPAAVVSVVAPALSASAAPVHAASPTKKAAAAPAASASGSLKGANGASIIPD